MSKDKDLDPAARAPLLGSKAAPKSYGATEAEVHPTTLANTSSFKVNLDTLPVDVLQNHLFPFLNERTKRNLACLSSSIKMNFKAKKLLNQDVFNALSRIGIIRFNILGKSLEILNKIKQVSYAPLSVLKLSAEFETSDYDLLCLIALGGNVAIFKDFIKKENIKINEFSLIQWKALQCYSALI